ncbi:YciI family protein [Luteimonas sp. Y-2-2-4F]|nr:YciI family protein [Luteimonas sp. Y-2-2-4F]MCD9033244.1 YciI family protein [Luteimonas sp. Y-2-2-4F]
MQYLLLVYIEEDRIAALPEGEFDRMMRDCLLKADGLREDGTLLDFRQLEPPATARTVRIRDGRTLVTDGPFAETKEFLAGFNLIEADSLEEAVRIAGNFPWAGTGSLEVRPLRDVAAVRRRVGA